MDGESLNRKEKGQTKSSEEEKTLAQKQVKRSCYESSCSSTDSASGISSPISNPEMSTESDTLSSLTDCSPSGAGVSDPMTPLPPDYVHSGDRAMLSTIDDVIFENDKFWDEKMKKELREYESYRDVHPSILTDASRSIKVIVDGTGPYKGTSGLRRVALQDYIGRLHKRDEKAVQVCKMLRDRIENLEDIVKDSKVRYMKLHRESKKQVEQVRYFWRSKIFEGNTRGGQSAMVYPDMHH